MRDIEKVINDILDIVPDSFKGKEELKTRLDYVIDDSKYRSPELMFICWQDAHIILNQILMSESLKTRNWIWWQWYMRIKRKLQHCQCRSFDA